MSLYERIEKLTKLKVGIMKICVLGLGEVGLPAAKYAFEKSLEVWGYDINHLAIDRAKKEGILRATRNWHEIPPVDVYVICASTVLKGDMPDLSRVFDICEKISHKSHSPSLVSIESTVVPGTSRKIYEEIFKRNTDLVHVPHRYWAGDPVRQLRVIGAINPESLYIGLRFYRNILDIPLQVVSSIEVAEMCKISENAYRYVQISFAEELKMICEEIELNFDDVRKACNTKWNIDIPEAREGIGGHCVPKDTRYLASLTTHNTLLRSAIIVDEKYREWLSRKLQR